MKSQAIARAILFAALATLSTAKGDSSPIDLGGCETIVIEGFKDFDWSQGSPYNTLTPRNRLTGCVATAGAQELAYWQWPYRAEDSRTSLHSLEGEDSVALFFDGCEPFDFSHMPPKPGSNPSKQEAYQISRLLLWCESLVNMQFARSGSGTNLRLNGITPFYTQGRSYSPSAANIKQILDEIKKDICAGSPMQISLSKPNHAAVVYGLAYKLDENGDYEKAFLLLNLGWGGLSYEGLASGWFDLLENLAIVKKIDVGFRPLKTAQLDPLPAESSLCPSLYWRIPNCYTNEVTGFKILAAKRSLGEKPGNFVDSFDTSLGVSSDNSAISVVSDGKDPSYLLARSGFNATYSYPEALLLQEDSAFSFTIGATNMVNMLFSLELRLDNGGWRTVCSRRFNGGESSETITASLGEYAFSRAQVRFALSETDLNHDLYNSGELRISGFSISNVKTFSIPLNEKEFVINSPEARSYTFKSGDLDKDFYYSFTVEPLMDANDSIPSRDVSSFISSSPSPAPSIKSVSAKVNGDDILEDGFFLRLGDKPCEIELDCENVSKIEAFSSHPYLLGKEAIEVAAQKRIITIDGSLANIASSGERLVLTIKASSANGSSVCKNLELQLFDTKSIVKNILAPVSTLGFTIENAILDSQAGWCNISSEPLKVNLSKTVTKFTVIFDAEIPDAEGTIFGFAPGGQNSIKARRMQDGTFLGLYRDGDNDNKPLDNATCSDAILSSGQHEIRIEYTDSNNAAQSVKGTSLYVDGKLFYHGEALQYHGQSINAFVFGAAAPTANSQDMLSGLKIKNLRIIDDVFANISTGEKKYVNLNGIPTDLKTSLWLIDAFALTSIETNITFEVANIDAANLKLTPDIRPKLENAHLALYAKTSLKDEWSQALVIEPSGSGEDIDLSKAPLDGFRFFQIRLE